MRKIWLVLKREYLVRVRTKAFILGTLALPVLSLCVLGLSVLVSGGRSIAAKRIAILDEVGGLAGGVREALLESASDDQPGFQVSETFESSSGQLETHLKSQVKQGDLDALLVLPQELARGKASAQLYARDFRAVTLIAPIQQAVTSALIERRLKEQGKKVEGIQGTFEPASIRVVNVSGGGGEQSEDDTFAVAIVAGIILYMTLIIYGMSTMRSVMEEKSTRIIEILVSSIKPFHLLTGKIVSVGAVALTQYVVWAIAFAIMAAFSGRFAESLRPGATAPSLYLPHALLIYLVVFFLAGYFLYASLYAAAGAIVSTDEEAHQVQMPLTLLILGSFMLFYVVLDDPNSTLSVVLSMTPFLSPILMTLRVAMQPPPFWQIALALLLSILTTIGVIRLSAKIYRVGILMYGKRPSLRELRRWLRYS